MLIFNFRAYIIVSVILINIAVAQAYTTDVHFPGGPGTTIEGTITEGTTANYRVEVPAGAKMSVWLESDKVVDHTIINENDALALLFDSTDHSAGVSYRTEGEGKYFVSVKLSPENNTSVRAANYKLTFHFESLPDATFGQRARLKPVVPLKVEWMPNFCRGEANLVFAARGPSVTTTRAFPNGNRLIVQGFYHGPSENVQFQCWFGLDGVYQAITRNQ